MSSSISNKTCTRCHTELPVESFAKNRRTKDGLTHECRSCKKSRVAKYHQRPEIKEKLKLKGQIRRSRPRTEEERQHDREKRQAYYLANKEKIQARQKKEGVEVRRERHRRFYQRHKERLRAKVNAKNRSLTKEQRESKFYNSKRKRMLTDPSTRIADCQRTRVRQALKGKLKAAKTFELVGCSQKELRQHLESLFTSGMNWNNYGKGSGRWHIDHIRPCASFDLTDSEQQRQCFHWSNLQPLWGEENMRKGYKEPSIAVAQRVDDLYRASQNLTVRA